MLPQPVMSNRLFHVSTVSIISPVNVQFGINSCSTQHGYHFYRKWNLLYLIESANEKETFSRFKLTRRQYSRRCIQQVRKHADIGLAPHYTFRKLTCSL